MSIISIVFMNIYICQSFKYLCLLHASYTLKSCLKVLGVGVGADEVENKHLSGRKNMQRPRSILLNKHMRLSI